ncbi:hypothetical protein D3C84_846800 [compost metagenome]
MGLLGIDQFAGTPAVWHVWANEGQITIVVELHITTDVAMPSAVEGKGQLVLGMMMPLKRNLVRQAPVQHRP